MTNTTLRQVRIPPGYLRGASNLEKEVLLKIASYGITLPQREYEFIPGRKWRADMAWPKLRVMIECEGGIFTGGRHNRGVGYHEDCDKYNHAQMNGWFVLRITPLHTGILIDELMLFIAWMDH